MKGRFQMMQLDNITSGGKIKIKTTKRGVEFHGWNFQRQRMIHVGTLQGQVYEKGNVTIFRKLNTINLPQSEYSAAVEAGAQFLRCIPRDQSCTYSISLKDFYRLKVDYHDPTYGPQWCCSVDMFLRTGKVSKRNPMIDAPAQAVGTIPMSTTCANCNQETKADYMLTDEVHPPVNGHQLEFYNYLKEQAEFLS